MTRCIILGAAGNVGQALAAGARAEGWEVETPELSPSAALVRLSFADAIVMDCLAPGERGWDVDWQNMFGFVVRAVALISKCESEGAKALFLPSSEWALVEPELPYSTAKLLVEAIAREQNRLGKVPVVVDRIGMEHADPSVKPRNRWEAGVQNRPGQLADRVIGRLADIVNGSASIAAKG